MDSRSTNHRHIYAHEIYDEASVIRYRDSLLRYLRTNAQQPLHHFKQKFGVEIPAHYAQDQTGLRACITDMCALIEQQLKEYFHYIEQIGYIGKYLKQFPNQQARKLLDTLVDRINVALDEKAKMIHPHKLNFELMIKFAQHYEGLLHDLKQLINRRTKDADLNFIFALRGNPDQSEYINICNFIHHVLIDLTHDIKNPPEQDDIDDLMICMQTSTQPDRLRKHIQDKANQYRQRMGLFAKPCLYENIQARAEEHNDLIKMQCEQRFTTGTQLHRMY